MVDSLPESAEADYPLVHPSFWAKIESQILPSTLDLKVMPLRDMTIEPFGDAIMEIVSIGSQRNQDTLATLKLEASALPDTSENRLQETKVLQAP